MSREELKLLVMIILLILGIVLYIYPTYIKPILMFDSAFKEAKILFANFDMLMKNPHLSEVSGQDGSNKYTISRKGQEYTIHYNKEKLKFNSILLTALALRSNMLNALQIYDQIIFADKFYFLYQDKSELIKILSKMNSYIYLLR